MLSLQACPSHSVQCSRLAVVSLLPTLLRGSPEPSGTESNSLWGLPGPANMDGLLASPHGAMLILPPPRPQAERRPSPQPSWSLDSPQAPCLSFPASLSPLPGDQEGSPALPGQAEPRALHVAGQAPPQHLKMLTCAAAPRPGVTEARPLPYVQKAARMGGPAAQAKGTCGLGKAPGSPLVTPVLVPPSPLLWNKQGALSPSCWTDLCQRGPAEWE